MTLTDQEKLMMQRMENSIAAALRRNAEKLPESCLSLKKEILAWTDELAALTAAAKVGEQRPTLEQIARTAEVITKAKLATIERCAETARLFSNVEKFTAEDVAARILALKDKP